MEVRTSKPEVRSAKLCLQPAAFDARLRSHASSIRAITFDVGGTLIEPWPSVGHIYAQVAARHGWPGLSVEALNCRFAEAWQAQKNFDYTRAAWVRVVAATFDGLMRTPPTPPFFRELYDRFSEPDAWRIFEDVVPALRALASLGLKLGVISNWDRRLEPLVRRLGLHEYLDTVLVSFNVGSAKPSPMIFNRAAERLALPPEAILHVGDSLEMDVCGAQQAGLHAVLLRRGAPKLAPGQIRSLRELY